MSINCVKQTITNACGHVSISLYKACNNHLLNSEQYGKCYRQSVDTTEVSISISIGNDFCNRGCEAIMLG